VELKSLLFSTIPMQGTVCWVTGSTTQRLQVASREIAFWWQMAQLNTVVHNIDTPIVTSSRLVAFFIVTGEQLKCRCRWLAKTWVQDGDDDRGYDGHAEHPLEERLHVALPARTLATGLCTACALVHQPFLALESSVTVDQANIFALLEVRLLVTEVVQFVLALAAIRCVLTQQPTREDACRVSVWRREERKDVNNYKHMRPHNVLN
jgi:hypothetical protein